MEIFGVHFCQDEITTFVFGIQPHVSLWIAWFDQTMRRFGRFFT